MTIDDYSLLVPPLLAGLIVLSTHVPLGREVLARGIIFIDLAVAQLAGLGVILVHVVFDHPHAWEIQLAAFVAALTGSLGFRWAEKHWSAVLEALIGVIFVLSVSMAILLLANDPHGAERLTDLLSGQLLWVTYDDLIIPLVLSLVILFIWFRGQAIASSTLFYVLFALSVTTSVQLVGVYLVFASLIIPALATRSFNGSSIGYAIGTIGYLFGLIWSFYSDLPTGPIVVWTMASAAMIFALLGKFKLQNNL